MFVKVSKVQVLFDPVTRDLHLFSLTEPRHLHGGGLQEVVELLQALEATTGRVLHTATHHEVTLGTGQNTRQVITGDTGICSKQASCIHDKKDPFVFWYLSEIVNENLCEMWQTECEGHLKYSNGPQMVHKISNRKENYLLIIRSTQLQHWKASVCIVSVPQMTRFSAKTRSTVSYWHRHRHTKRHIANIHTFKQTILTHIFLEFCLLQDTKLNISSKCSFLKTHLLNRWLHSF